MSSRSSTPESARRLPDRICVATVRRVHGIRGAVVVEVHSDNPERFAAGNTMTASLTGGGELPLTIETASAHTGGLLLTFAEVSDRDAAQQLRGASLEVDRAAVPPAPEGTYYFFELVGCHCFDGAEALGRVEDVLEDGGGLLLLVRDGDRQVPIPFVERFLRRVDVGQGRIDFELPPGLIEACASTS